MNITAIDRGKTLEITGIEIESINDKDDVMYWQIALSLAISLWNISKEKNQIDKENYPTQISNVIGYFASSVVLKSLSIEILLKFLSYKKIKDFKHTHDLKKLYDNLDGETKKVIIDISKQQEIESIEKTIELHKNDFTDWRYAFEGNKLTLNNLNNLDNILNVLSLTEKKMYNTQFRIELSGKDIPAPLTYPTD